MDEEYNYDALANTINIEDITSNKTNRNILRLLKDNDPSFDMLRVCNTASGFLLSRSYIPEDGEDVGWLGYFIGRNTSLRWIDFDSKLIHDANFYLGLNRNQSIKKIHCTDLRDGQICQMVAPFLKNNPNLTEFDIRNLGPEGIRQLSLALGQNKSIQKLNLANIDLTGGQICLLDEFLKNNENLTKLWVKSCELGTEGARDLSLTLGNCNKSLKHIFLSDIHFEAGHVSQIVLALSMHPQLKELNLSSMNIGRNECTALATLLRITTKQLQTLWLSNNNIDDEGVETLVHAISGSKLQVLSLDRNPTITSRGRHYRLYWKGLTPT